MQAHRPEERAFSLHVNRAGLIGQHAQNGWRLATDDVVMHLAERVGVALVPGTAYVLLPYVRLSIATSTDRLDEGAARIACAVAALQ